MGRGDKGVKISIASEFDPKGFMAAEARTQRLAEMTLANSGTMAGGWVKAGHELQVYGERLQRTGKSIAGFGDSMTRNVTLPIVAGMGMAAKMAADEEKEVALLAQTLRTNASATDETLVATEAWITAMQDATGIADGELRPALATIARSTKDAAEAQEYLTVAMDISTATGKDLESVSQAIAKAHNGNVGALGRLGIATKDAEGKTLSFDEVMKQAAETFRGSAATAADTAAGKIAIMQAKLADAAETIGANVLPIVGDLAEDIGALAKRFGELTPEQQKTIIKLLAVAAATGPVISGLGRTVQGAGMLISTAGKVTTAIGKWADGSAGASAALGKLSTAFGTAATAGKGFIVTAGPLIAALAVFGVKVMEVDDSFETMASGIVMGGVPAMKDLDKAVADGLTSWDALAESVESAGTSLLTTEQKAYIFEKAGRDLIDTTAALKDELGYAEQALRDLTSAQDEAENADIRYERAQLRLTDAEKAYTDAVKDHGKKSREAIDAELDLRQARLDLKAATSGLAESVVGVSEALANVPRPNGTDAEEWAEYYQLIGDMAGYAAAQANAANTNFHGGHAPSHTGGHNLPVYGSGGYVGYEHMAIVGDVPEIIFPLGDASFARDWLPTLLDSLPRQGSTVTPPPASGIRGAENTTNNSRVKIVINAPSGNANSIAAEVKRVLRMDVRDASLMGA